MILIILIFSSLSFSQTVKLENSTLVNMLLKKAEIDGVSIENGQAKIDNKKFTSFGKWHSTQFDNVSLEGDRAHLVEKATYMEAYPLRKDEKEVHFLRPVKSESLYSSAVYISTPQFKVLIKENLSADLYIYEKGFECFHINPIECKFLKNANASSYKVYDRTISDCWKDLLVTEELLTKGDRTDLTSSQRSLIQKVEQAAEKKFKDRSPEEMKIHVEKAIEICKEFGLSPSSSQTGTIQDSTSKQ